MKRMLQTKAKLPTATPAGYRSHYYFTGLPHSLPLYTPLQLTPGVREFPGKIINVITVKLIFRGVWRGMELWVTSGHGSNVWDVFMYCNSAA